jgi:hypothetical protein
LRAGWLTGCGRCRLAIDFIGYRSAVTTPQFPVYVDRCGADWLDVQRKLRGLRNADKLATGFWKIDFRIVEELVVFFGGV